MGAIIAVLVICAGLIAMFCVGYSVGHDNAKAKFKRKPPLDEWREWSKARVKAGECPLCLEPLEDGKCTQCNWGEVSNFQ